MRELVANVVRGALTIALVLGSLWLLGRLTILILDAPDFDGAEPLYILVGFVVALLLVLASLIGQVVTEELDDLRVRYRKNSGDE